MDNPIIRAEHEEFVRRMDAENARQNHRIDALEEEVKKASDMVANVERLAVSMESMAKEQEKQGKRLEVLESRDGQMWRKVTTYAITAIISIVLGFIFAQFGM